MWKGIGEKLAPQFLAKFGDIRRFHSADAFLRKVGYEIMTSFTRQKPIDNNLYIYKKKKESEGKAKNVAKVAEQINS